MTITTGLGRSLCSGALTRSSNERISHLSLRLLLLGRTACSFSNRIRQVQCGSEMRIEITNRHQMFHVILNAAAEGYAGIFHGAQARAS